MSVIKFPAVVYKCQTLIDGGIRVTLDLAEDCIPQMAMLAEARREGIALVFEAKTNHIDSEMMDGRKKRGRNSKEG